jgi:hypothetical protein
LGLLALLVTQLALFGVYVQPAQALPSYARQTGEECAACHVGGFGPQLTPFGMVFKMGGYTESNSTSLRMPLSGMAVASFTNTAKDLSEDPGKYVGVNNNLSMQEISAFLAGRLTNHVGTFVQTTYSGVENIFSLDNMDLRFAGNVDLGGKDTILGLSVNNNPTISDPFNTLSAWSFPYIASEVAPTPAAAPLIQGGLEYQVLGGSAYGFFNDSIYAEAGAYGSLSRSTLHSLGIGADAGDLSGAAPYWRLAWFKDKRKSAYSLGLFGLAAKLHPDFHSGPTNDYLDMGVDASYQFLGSRAHIFTVNGSYTHEHQKLNASLAAGDANRSSATLQNINLNASYTYKETYGLRLGLFDTWGDRDTALYAPAPDGGSRTGKPDSNGLILEADWTPFGKEDSWAAPWANLRVGLQYTLYNQFNGASSNYDGFGRDASDNNTLFLYLWSAI